MASLTSTRFHGGNASRATALLGLLLLSCGPLAAQDAAPAARAKPRGRLPAYYAKVISAPQKEQVYRVQAEYEQRIDALESQIAALEKQRNDAIRALLTPEQRKQVDALAAEAKTKRDARQAALKRAEGEAASVAPAATPTAKAK